MTTPIDSAETPLSPLPPESAVTSPAESPTFVKLAMRNMVRQGGKSIYHFALTTVGLLGLLVGLAFITR